MANTCEASLLYIKGNGALKTYTVQIPAVIGRDFCQWAIISFFSMILKFSMGHYLSFYTDFYGPFPKLIGLWPMAPCLPNHCPDLTLTHIFWSTCIDGRTWLTSRSSFGTSIWIYGHPCSINVHVSIHAVSLCEHKTFTTFACKAWRGITLSFSRLGIKRWRSQWADVEITLLTRWRSILNLDTWCTLENGWSKVEVT